jgi:hypothetical protein
MSKWCQVEQLHNHLRFRILKGVEWTRMRTFFRRGESTAFCTRSPADMSRLPSVGGRSQVVALRSVVISRFSLCRQRTTASAKDQIPGLIDVHLSLPGVSDSSIKDYSVPNKVYCSHRIVAVLSLLTETLLGGLSAIQTSGEHWTRGFTPRLRRNDLY